MPAFEEAFTAYLLDDPGIAAAVADRVNPMRLPEKSIIPAISWHRVSAAREYTYDPFPDEHAFTTARIQIDCWAYTAMEAMDVADAVLAALSGYDGDFGGEFLGATFAVNEFDTYEAPTKLHRRILDFMVSYEDALTAS